jgi:hypothetical protein
MKILYETTLDDLVAFHRHDHDHSPASRPKGFFAKWGWLVAGSVHTAVVRSLGWQRGLGDVLMDLAVLSCVYFVLFRRLRRWWNLKSR